VHNYFLIEHNYSDSVSYNFKPELKLWKTDNVVKMIILLILISKIIIFNNNTKKFVINHL